jgi:anti-sigma regulatory factor (Ser/Thr protein kinase)
MSEAVAIDLPLEPGSARRAREGLKPFRGSMDDTSFSDLRLLVDELVVEAVRAEGASAPGLIKLRAELDGDRVRVVVAQGGDAYRLPSRRPEPGDPGFGLHLVQRLSDRWGMRRDQDNATVWLEILGHPQRAG